MSASKERKERARAEREERERRTALAEQRRKRLGQLGAALAVAAVVVVVLVLVSQGSDESPNAGSGGGGEIAGVTDTRELLNGIEQRGTSLGDPKAPLVLTEFADLQCPFCAQFARDVLPGVIERFVRPGKLRLELRTLTFIGEDSVRGAKAAHAAAERNRMWNFSELWFRNQGQEESGYADDDYITSIARASGLMAKVALDGIESAALGEPLREAQAQAAAAGISSTPSFVIGPQAGKGQQLPFDGSAASFNSAIDARLSQR